MRRTLRPLFIGCAMVGVAGGSFGVTSALSSTGEGQADDQRLVAITLSPGPFAATDGNEPAVFSYSFDELRDVPGVTIVSVDESGICADIQFLGGMSQGTCTDRATLETGLGYAAFGQDNGTYFIVGFVPDEVDSVEVGGHAVSLMGNVWTSTIDSGIQLDLRVGNSKAAKWATLGSGD